jgi:predicted RNase H-like nuclease
VEELIGIGADGARGGWLAARCYRSSNGSTEYRTVLSLEPTFKSLVALRSGSGAVLAVDVPMGLLERVAPRPCDTAARKLLRKRASTVFTPPSRPLLSAKTYAEARELIAKLKLADPTAAGVSVQAFGLVPKVLEADVWLRAHRDAQAWLYECHPELSFYAMAGAVLDDKRSPHGQLDRLRHVTAEFRDAPEVIAASRFHAKEADLSDVLDAYAGLATALHIRTGEHEEFGGELDDVGLAMRIVF